MEFDDNGCELPDNTPIAVPMRFRQRSYFDSIREMIRNEISKQAQDQGHETFEEANDFDVGDDFDPSAPYEEQFDPDTGVSQWDFKQEVPKPEPQVDPEPEPEPEPTKEKP